jgi:hypothetical protein
MRDYNHFLRSRPVELHWAGWRSDTLSLQQAGWSISAHQDMHRMQMQLALRNERAGATAVTAGVDWNYLDDAEHYGRHVLPRLPVHVMGKVQIMHSMGDHWDNFKPIDALPQMYERRRGNLEDFVHFAPNLARTQQIIVPEQSVDDLMARILEMQQGARIERLREEVREGERVSFEPRQKFHAQIISLAA